MTIPTDPLYGNQWHFPLIGDIETIWDEYSGAGVKVGVYDDGVDYNHVDLNDNYDASLHATDDFGNPIDPFPVGNDAHGTACAGLIGAESNNGTGGTGVASGVTLTGVNIFNSAIYGYVNAASSAGFMDVAQQAASNFDISSNSWGSTPGWSADQNINDAFSFAGQLHSVYGDLSANGRGGLGTIIVQAAGNDALDAGGSGVNGSRFTITVAASDQFGNIQDYSDFGSSILVTAPAGSVTTDITGGAGYDAGDYTSTFGGTSAATPIVSGVVALMLEANSGLGWRDVQNIIAMSASETGSGYGNTASGFEVGEWSFNGANNWNGGGMAISGSYGFGMIDAYAAVRMAEIWHLFDNAQTSANEVMVSSNTLVPTSPVFIPAGAGGVNFSLTVTQDISIEHVTFNLGFNTTYVGDVEVVITTPDGTVIQVMYSSFASGSFNGIWAFGIDHLLGETSAGTWTINVADTFALDALEVTSMSLDIYGQTIDNNDVYHYTEDFGTLFFLDPSRLGLEDTNGGIDWINLAAIGEDILLDMQTGVVTAMDDFGNPIDVNVLVANSGIENIVLGDGNDNIRGTTAGNEMHGMRGDDVLLGIGGNDTLYGGMGDDRLNGGAGQDLLDGGDGNDTLFGRGGVDTLYGGEGADFLNGGTQADALHGGGGADTIYGDDGADFMEGDDGADTLYGGNDDDLMYGGADADLMYGGNQADIMYGGTGADTIYGDNGADLMYGGTGMDTIYGGNDSDVISGGNDADALYGGNQADIIYGDNGDDEIEGGNGTDTLYGGGDNDYIFGGNDNDDIYGGAGFDTIYGDFGSDLIDGGDQGDLLYGGSQSDTIIGGNGDDILYGNNGSDVMYGGNDVDYMYGGNDNDLMYGGGQMDVMFGGTHGDIIFGGTGDDILYGEGGADEIYGGDNNDLVYGGGQSDLLYGGSGADEIYGGDGNDALYGGLHSDVLDGGNNNDTLNGGAGSDVLTGGAGADSFVFEDGSGTDVITDFTVNVDEVNFNGFTGIGSFAQWLAASNQVGADVVTTVGSDTITFLNVDLNSFDADDFFF